MFSFPHHKSIDWWAHHTQIPLPNEEMLASWLAPWSKHGELKCILRALEGNLYSDIVCDKSPTDFGEEQNSPLYK